VYPTRPQPRLVIQTSRPAPRLVGRTLGRAAQRTTWSTSDRPRPMAPVRVRYSSPSQGCDVIPRGMSTDSDLERLLILFALLYGLSAPYPQR